VPHLLFASPTCLFGTPFAFWRSHLPFGASICLFGTPFAFWHPHLPFGAPICLLQAPFAFWPLFYLMCIFNYDQMSCVTLMPSHPIFSFFENTHEKMSGSKKGPWCSIPRVQFMDDIIIMCNDQSALPTASAILAASFPRVRMCLKPSHHFVWAHNRDCSSSLFDPPCGICEEEQYWW
jgi:hypothetical protein